MKRAAATRRPKAVAARRTKLGNGRGNGAKPAPAARSTRAARVAKPARVPRPDGGAPKVDATLLRDAAERGIRYLERLDARGVSPTPAAVAALARFAEPLPDGPSDPAAVLRLLDEVGSPATIGIAGDRKSVV